MRHSKSGLILIEMILVILFLAIAGSFCARIFVGAHQTSQQAENLSQAQQQAGSAAELLKEKDPDWNRYFPKCRQNGGSITVSYDADWQICDADQAVYQMVIVINSDGSDRTAEIQMSDASGKSIYQVESVIHFPKIYDKTGREGS